MLAKLKFHGSRYRLNLATCTELRKVANEALNEGFYSPALVDAALDAEDNLWAIGPAFMDALTDLGVVVSESTEDCIWDVLRYSTQRIATSVIEPEVGLDEIMAVYRGCELYERSQKFTGDSHDIEYLIGAYWEYDEIWERYVGTEVEEVGKAEARNLDQEVIKRCQVWLHKHDVEQV